jgi:3-oxoacyl-[acyl-carrier protein] reductase
MSDSSRPRAALVTGSAMGIGRAIATHLAQNGCRVLLADRSPEVMDVAAELGARAAAICVDLSEEDEVLELAERARREFGGCDILVNNAGINPKNQGQPYRMEELSTELWNLVLRTNLGAPFLLCRELIPPMRERGWGRVVNVASRAGRTYLGHVNLAYSTSKAGLIGLSRQLGGENASFGITVNIVAPGRIDTPLSRQNAPDVLERIVAGIPANRSGIPDEIAAAVTFLASDAASYITGACLDVNGGAFIG